MSAASKDETRSAVRLAEPGSVDHDELATRETFSEETVGGRRYAVERVSAGWEIAGSMLRWTDGYFIAAVYDSTGTRSGQQFGPKSGSPAENQAAARSLIARWIKDRRDQIAEAEATRSWIADLEDGGYL